MIGNSNQTEFPPVIVPMRLEPCLSHQYCGMLSKRRAPFRPPPLIPCAHGSSPPLVCVADPETEFGTIRHSRNRVIETHLLLIPTAFILLAFLPSVHVLSVLPVHRQSSKWKERDRQIEP